MLRDVGEVGKAFLTLKGAQATAEATASAREAWPVHGLLYDNGEGPMILGSKHVGSTTMRVDRTGNVKLEKEETLYLPDGTLVQEFTFRRGRASMYVTPLEQVIVIWRQRDPAGEHPPLLAIMDTTPCIVGYLTICQHLAGRST